MSAQLQAPRVFLRHLAEDDLDAVAEIEKRAYPFPWTRGIFSDCLRVGYTCIGLLRRERLVGYSILSFGPEEAHLLNLCIAPEAQRSGLGEFLLDHMLSMASARAARTLYLEVRPSNGAAIKLYEKRGFRHIGRRPRYYPTTNGREDAVVMAYSLTT